MLFVEYSDKVIAFIIRVSLCLKNVTEMRTLFFGRQIAKGHQVMDGAKGTFVNGVGV